MTKIMSLSAKENAIYYGMVDNFQWVGEKEDVTHMAISSVFDWLIMQHEKECPDGTYRIRLKYVPYVLSIQRVGRIRDYHDIW